MTRQEYEKRMSEIISKIDTMDVFDVECDLEQLGEYKPVRLGLYYLQSKNRYMHDKDGNEVFKLLSGKMMTANKYLHNKECLKFYREISESWGNYFDVKRFNYLMRSFDEDFTYYVNLFKKCESVEEDTDNNPDIDFEAYRELYGCREFIGYLIHQRARRIKFPDMKPLREFEWVNNLPNMKYLLQELSGETAGLFVLIESEENIPVIDLLSTDLQLLGKKVFRLKNPLVYEGADINIEDTLSVSVDAMECRNNMMFFTPIELVYADGRRVDNRPHILEYISQNYNEGKQLNVLADGWITDDLSLRQGVRQKLVRITPYTADINQFNLTFFSYGSYLDYISKVYNTDCKKLLEVESNVRFSIVVPARNSAETLRYTLQTCLEQSYKGAYEIIVSDNSTGHNAEVYNLCKELNDSRIVYLKTPRDLHLPKSFEYAYLHAKGEYIFAIGSDDGVLPWALDTLEQVIAQFPDEEIIQWERGFYAWPGFNGGQQHQLVIPADYEKDSYNLFYREKADYIASVLKDSTTMYSLPMLYINSCFKRSYLKTLLEKTGRLWDGICQDIYMGVITACIHPQILNMRYPLTIAGMSSGSVGANANMAKKTDDEFNKMMQETMKDNNVGGFCASYWERLLPQTGTDTSSLYGSLLRAVSFGIIPEEYLDNVFDWKDMFMHLAKEMDIRDVAFDRKIHEMQYAASKHGEEFLQWFNEKIFYPSLEPRQVDEKKIQKMSEQKTYQRGRLPQGGMILDASEYHVQNVYDAVKLFEQLTGL